MTITLRPDQEASLAELRAALAASCKRVLMQAPTGWGKGTVAAVCLAEAARRGHRPAFVCHREEINLDLVARLRAAGAESVRVLMGTHAEGDANAAVTVVSVQTLDRRELELDCDLFWWDEAHRAAAASYQRSADRHPNALHIGTTATPARADGRALDFFERMIPGPQVAQLVALGLLAPITCYSPDSASNTLSDDPVALYPAGRPGVVFCKSLEHSRDVAAALQARGIKAEHVEGKTEDRPALVRAFNEARVDVLVNHRLLVEGVDIPRAEVCVFASPVSSVVAYLQAIGRVRRPRPGKRATLFDLCGSFHVHGHPDVDRVFSLEGKAIRPAGEALPSCTQCPGCLSWGPASSTCEVCGFQRPAPKPPKLSKRELREQRLEAQPKTGADYELWCDLVRTVRSRGFKPAYAFLKFRERTGRSPRWSFKQVPEDVADAVA